jgi:hypothetical protein
LWNDFGYRVAVLGMIYSRVEEVLPFLIKSANDLGLVVFDWGMSLSIARRQLFLMFARVSPPCRKIHLLSMQCSELWSHVKFEMQRGNFVARMIVGIG